MCWLLLIVGLLAAAAFPGGSVALAAAHTSEALPCGVDAVVGMARILGQETDAATVAELAADYAAPRLMSVLEVAREVHALTGVKPQVVEASFDELMWLDRPHIVHLTSEECSECPGQGHAVAVERFAGEWAVTVGADGTHLLSASQLRRCYGGHAVMVMGPVAPALAFDSYLVVLPNVVAGLSRVCRVGLRNVGDGMLSIARVECGDGIQCNSFPGALAPGDSGQIELTVCPSHRLDQPADTRTFFLHVHSNDPVRPRTSVALRCTVVEPVVVRSPVVYFPRVTPSLPGERIVSIECRPPVRLVAAVSEHPQVVTALTESGRGLSSTQYQLRITVSAEGLQPGVTELPIQLRLHGAESEGAKLIARVRVWPDADVISR